MRTMLVLLFSLALFATGCSGGTGSTSVAPPDEPAATTAAPTTTAAAPTTVTPDTTAPTTTVAPTTTIVSGAVSDTCANGWSTPAPGTPFRKLPLDAIREYLGLNSDDLFIVETMRYFTGQEDVGVIAPRDDYVDRWYIEAHLQSDPTVTGRWIVRAFDGDEGGSVMAEAPTGTTGFEPGIWMAETGGEVGSVGEQYDPFDPPCTAANGPYCQCNWGAEGCSCDDDEIPMCTGIPPTVMGCLNGL